MKHKLETMSTAQLEELLRSELDKGRDRKKVMQILRILEERDSCNSTIISEATARKPRKWMSRAIAIAAVLTVLLVMVPPAFGAENIFEILGRWTQDVFCFFAPCEEGYVYKTDHPGLQQLYDTMQEHGATERCVPTWLPEGYELEALKIFEQRMSTKIISKFSNGDSFVIVSFEVHDEKTSNAYPKDDDSIEVFEREGIKHYIMPNDEKWIGIWNTGNIECSVTVNEDIEFLYKLIKSIYKEN